MLSTERSRVAATPPCAPIRFGGEVSFIAQFKSAKYQHRLRRLAKRRVGFSNTQLDVI